MTKQVVLVDEQNNVLGTVPKDKVHGKQTPLHRAFSCFIFHKKDKKLLLQQRSHKKIAWPLAWSNSCCGHPQLNESNIDAAKRRLKDELGLESLFLEQVAPYRYCFSRDNIMENEICPIIVGITNQEPEINTCEVEAIKWIDWNEFLRKVELKKYSPWCCEEAMILDKNNKFKKLIFSHKI